MTERIRETEPSGQLPGAGTTRIPTGWDRASATVISEPGRCWRCWIELVNSKMKDSCLCCLADQGGETLNLPTETRSGGWQSRQQAAHSRDCVKSPVVSTWAPGPVRLLNHMQGA